MGQAMAESANKGARVPLYSWAATGLPLGLFAWFCSYVPAVSAGESRHWVVQWLPQHDIALSFFVDGLSLLFALLITGIGTLIFLYAAEYMRGAPQIGRFTAILAAFMLSMLGIVLSDDLITLFIAWEVTGVTSFLLIGYRHEEATSRRSAWQALMVTGAGGLAMLAGFVLLGEVAGTYSLREILAQPGELSSDHRYHWILALVLAGAFTKSAQFPFHFWLPNAMAAPTPVSAYLHSATMVKAGVFLLARMAPMLGGTDEWTTTLVTVGAVTMVYSSIVALTRTDLKQVLAYTTVMALGACVLFLGVPAQTIEGGVSPAAVAAMCFVLVHALYKAALFMAAGAIEHSTGTRDLRLLGGLGTRMRWTSVGILLACVSMVGLPPTIGFIGKEALYGSALAAPSGTVVLVAVLLASALIGTIALVLAGPLLWGRLTGAVDHAEPAPWQLWCGPAILGAAGIVAGLLAGPTFGAFVLPAAASVGELPEHFIPSLWHGFGPELLLSVATWGLAAVVFWKRRAVARVVSSTLSGIPVTGDSAYDKAMHGIAASASGLTAVLQSGVHRRYVATVFASLALVLATTLVVRDAVHLPQLLPEASFFEWMLGALIAASALTVIFTRSRLLAIGSIGVVGTAASLIFLLFGAPDVAMAQLMVETLVVVIVAIVLLRLPSFHYEIRQNRPRQLRDAAVAIAVGAATTLVLLAVISEPPQRFLTDYFERTAVPGAHGRNIVNVILVDFRALDTLGEITVLFLAGSAVCALIQRRSRYRRLLSLVVARDASAPSTDSEPRQR